MTNTEDKEPDSADFVSDDLLYLLVDCLEIVDDLCLSIVNDELHVGYGKSFRVHHQLLRHLAEVGCLVSFSFKSIKSSNPFTKTLEAAPYEDIAE